MVPRKKYFYFGIILAIILAISFFVGTTDVHAATNEPDQISLTLSRENNADEAQFAVSNMLPGDVIEKQYRLKVCYNNTVKLRFSIDIKPDSEKLAEVLKCKIVTGENGELYNGLMSNVPSELIHNMTTKHSVSEDVDYTIKVYLDSDVGNEYQAKTLVADFRWWIEETENLEPNPDTSNISGIIFFIMFGCSILVAVIILIRRNTATKESDKPANKTKRTMMRSLVLLLILSTCFCVTASAFNAPEVFVKDNAFKTGTIKINLNDEKPIVGEHGLRIEPGAINESDFFVENVGTNDAYYKLYFDNVNDGMKNLLHITIKEKENILYSGTIAHLSTQQAEFPWELIKVGEKKDLKISFYLAGSCGNEVENCIVSFDVHADAIQTSALVKK